jgi:hypothetical protein
MVVMNRGRGDGQKQRFLHLAYPLRAAGAQARLTAVGAGSILDF